MAVNDASVLRSPIGSESAVLTATGSSAILTYTNNDRGRSCRAGRPIKPRFPGRGWDVDSHTSGIADGLGVNNQHGCNLLPSIPRQTPRIGRTSPARTAFRPRTLHNQGCRLCFRSQAGILYRTSKVNGWRQTTFTRSSLAQGRGQGWHAAPVTQPLLPRFGAAQGWDSPLRGTIPSEGLIVRGQSDFPPACWIFADC